MPAHALPNPREPLPATVEEPLAQLSVAREPQLSSVGATYSPREPQLREGLVLPSSREPPAVEPCQRGRSPQEARGLLSLREPLGYGHRLSPALSGAVERSNRALRAALG